MITFSVILIGRHSENRDNLFCDIDWAVILSKFRRGGLEKDMRKLGRINIDWAVNGSKHALHFDIYCTWYAIRYIHPFI